MSLQTYLSAAKEKVSLIEAEIAALPAEIKDKTENELSKIYHAIAQFFGGHDAVPAPVSEAPEEDSIRWQQGSAV